MPKGHDTGAATIAPTVDAVCGDLFAECFRITNRGRRKNLLVHFVISILPLILSWGTEAWLSNFVLIVVLWTYATVNILFSRHLQMKPQTDQQLKFWGRALYVQIAFMAILYNLIFFNLHHHGIENAMLFGLLTLSLLSAGAISTYHYLKLLGVTFVVFAMTPQVAYYLTLGTEEGRFFAFLVVVFIAFISNTSFEVHGNAMHVLMLNRELELAKKKAEHMAMTDALTGLGNRRAFFEQGKVIISGSSRYHYDTSLMMIDIDNFKMINDTYGHAIGDQVIQKTAQALRNGVRDSDVIGRIGGEEFAIILPGTKYQKAYELAERLRQTIAQMIINEDSDPIQFTISIGVTECVNPSETVDDLLTKADRALYAAKGTGRNKTMPYATLA